MCWAGCGRGSGFKQALAWDADRGSANIGRTGQCGSSTGRLAEPVVAFSILEGQWSPEVAFPPGAGGGSGRQLRGREGAQAGRISLGSSVILTGRVVGFYLPSLRENHPQQGGFKQPHHLFIYKCPVWEGLHGDNSPLLHTVSRLDWGWRTPPSKQLHHRAGRWVGAAPEGAGGWALGPASSPGASPRAA